jgi:hypothetical protein
MAVKHKIIDMTKNKELIGQEITLEKIKLATPPEDKFLTIKAFNEFKKDNSKELEIRLKPIYKKLGID